MTASFEDAFEGWAKFAEVTKGRPPRPLLMQALPFVLHRGQALDIGAGALNDSRFLLDKGFGRVIALDAEPIAQEAAAAFPKDRFEYQIATLESFAFPVDAFDLVNAQFVLPFVGRPSFEAVFASIVGSLNKGGIFTGQLFGDRDDWAQTASMTFHTHSEAQALFGSLTVLHFREEDDPGGRIASGESKHWHLFEFIVRR
jgi:SAM-dependent methyltransferase